MFDFIESSLQYKGVRIMMLIFFSKLPEKFSVEPT